MAEWLDTPQCAHAFMLAWPAAFTIVLIAAPTVQRLTQRLITPDAVQP